MKLDIPISVTNRLSILIVGIVLVSCSPPNQAGTYCQGDQEASFLPLLIDNNSCNTDSDCIVDRYGYGPQCCQAFCKSVSVNILTSNQWTAWREKSCPNNNSYCEKGRIISCPDEGHLCRYNQNPILPAKCINSRCVPPLSGGACPGINVNDSMPLFVYNNSCDLDSDCVLDYHAYGMKETGIQCCYYDCSHDAVAVNKHTAEIWSIWREKFCLNENSFCSNGEYLICPRDECRSNRPVLSKCINSTCQKIANCSNLNGDSCEQ